MLLYEFIDEWKWIHKMNCMHSLNYHEILWRVTRRSWSAAQRSPNTVKAVKTRRMWGKLTRMWCDMATCCVNWQESGVKGPEWRRSTNRRRLSSFRPQGHKVCGGTSGRSFGDKRLKHWITCELFFYQTLTPTWVVQSKLTICEISSKLPKVGSQLFRYILRSARDQI